MLIFQYFTNNKRECISKTIVSDIFSLFFCRRLQQVATKVCLPSHYKCADVIVISIYDRYMMYVHILEIRERGYDDENAK
ncbi:hypothetical protein SAMN03159341_105242 [Paenibacillus sp. 1_12]|nr:hypothetical protein SAMN03159341_105242 [Paenibacillus sp. 1_12]